MGDLTVTEFCKDPANAKVMGCCPCGDKCTMEQGGSGTCQADFKTCATNTAPVQCPKTSDPEPTKTVATGAINSTQFSTTSTAFENAAAVAPAKFAAAALAA